MPGKLVPFMRGQLLEAERLRGQDAVEGLAMMRRGAETRLDLSRFLPPAMIARSPPNLTEPKRCSKLSRNSFREKICVLCG